jgi:hypothetical protein
MDLQPEHHPAVATGRSESELSRKLGLGRSERRVCLRYGPTNTVHFNPPVARRWVPCGCLGHRAVTSPL